MPYVAPDHFSNGLYLDGGIGYQIHIKRKNTLLVSLGYSYKTVKETGTEYFYTPNSYLLGIAYPYPETDIYNYHLTRISIKLGWAIN